MFDRCQLLLVCPCRVSCRHSMLLSQSSSWIPPDKFEARIAEALANPKPL